MSSTRAYGLLAFLLSGAGAFGQMALLPGIRPQPSMVWDEDTLGVMEAWSGNLKAVPLGPGPLKDIPALPGTPGSSFWGGVLHCVRLIEGRFVFARRALDGPWTETDIQVDPASALVGIPRMLLPSEKPGWFLGMNADTGFTSKGEASCCSWWRMDPNGTLRIEALIPIAFEGPAYVPFPTEGKLRVATPNPSNPGLTPILDTPIRVPGAFVIVSWKAGILWVIRDGNPVPTRTLDLNGISKDFLKGKRPFPPIVLGVQPLRNGQVLIAKRSRRALEETHTYLVEPAGEAPRAMDYEHSGRELDASILAYPDIEWLVFDPITGDLTAAPEHLLLDAPRTLRSGDEVRRFSFGFDARERLVVPWTPSRLVPPEPKPVPEGRPARPERPPVTQEAPLAKAPSGSAA